MAFTSPTIKLEIAVSVFMLVDDYNYSLGGVLIVLLRNVDKVNGQSLVNIYCWLFDCCVLDGPIRVEGLTPSSKYMFIIRAINEVGQGDGYEVEVETPQQS